MTTSDYKRAPLTSAASSSDAAAAWPCLSPRHVLVELGLLWAVLGLQLARLGGHDLPWYAAPATLTPWLFLRWPLPRHAARRSPLVTSLQWLRVHTGGLALGFATLSLLFGVSPTALLPVAGLCLLVLTAWTCISVPPLRERLSFFAMQAWRLLWPDTGEVLAPLLAVWLWDRLALPVALPWQVYLWIAAAGGTVAWLTRGLAGRWRCLLPATLAAVPLLISLAGTPDGQDIATLLVLGGMIATATLAHGFVAPALGADARELSRLWLLGLAALWLAEPLLTAESTGGGDAQWYSLVLADAIAQWHAGFFPFVGQSEFAFNGSAFPGCFAPYYQLFGLLINIVTGDTLSVYAVKHLTAALSLTGGVFAAYGVLGALAPSKRGLAALFAILYVASPAWLGAIYGMDMYMTVMTLPWLPCVFFGCVLTFVRLDARSLLWVVVPLSLVWHAHSPVALWTTLGVLVAQLYRIARHRSSWRKELIWALAAAGLFLALTCLPFASAYHAEKHTDEFRHDYVMETLRQHWHDAWLPVSAGAERLSDQHLGWGLGLLALLGAARVMRLHRHAMTALFVVGAGLLLLLVPIPGAQSALWEAMPDAIKSVTNNWPTQRLYPVLAALVLVAGGGATLRALRLQPRQTRCVAAVAALALIWSLSEAAKFQRRGRATTLNPRPSARRLLPENIVLTRYAYEMFSRRPDYVTHGMMNPLMKNQLLRLGSLEVLDSNSAAALRSPPVQEFFLRRRPGAKDEFRLTPAILLRPGRQYILDFLFGHQNLIGDLRLHGARLERTYHLPSDGGANSFGSAPGQARFLTVWTSGENVETLRWQYRPKGGENPAVFARVRMIEIDPGRLPADIDSLLPYRGTIRAPEPVWLETPRMFLPGYSASVDGRAAEVRDSPQGLVMVRVPAGVSRVELRYDGPWLVRTALWLSSAAWLSVLLFGGGLLIARKFKSPPPDRPGPLLPAEADNASTMPVLT